MPIDYKTLSDNAETSLQDFIGGQQARSLKDIDATRMNAQTARSPLFQAAMGLGNDPAAFQEQANLVQRRLGTNLDSALALRRMQEGQSAIGNQYNNLVRRGGEQDARLNAANAYSRQTFQQNMTQKQQAADLQRQIQNQYDRGNEADSFTKQGVAQENAAAPSSNDLYQQAMYRALFGLAGSAATLGGYAYAHRTPTPATQLPTQGFKMNDPMYDNSYYGRANTGFSTPLDLYGRR